MNVMSSLFPLWMAIGRDVFVAPILLFFLILLSGISPSLTVIVLLVLLPGLFLGLNYFHPKMRFSNFYASWTISSFALLVGVFELEVMPYLDILVVENSIILLFVIMTV